MGHNWVRGSGAMSHQVKGQWLQIRRTEQTRNGEFGNGSGEIREKKRKVGYWS